MVQFCGFNLFKQLRKIIIWLIRMSICSCMTMYSWFLKVVASRRNSSSWTTAYDVGLEEVKFLSSEQSGPPIAQFHWFVQLQNTCCYCCSPSRQRVCELTLFKTTYYSHSQVERQLLQRHRLERWDIENLPRSSKQSDMFSPQQILSSHTMYQVSPFVSYVM